MTTKSTASQVLSQFEPGSVTMADLGTHKETIIKDLLGGSSIQFDRVAMQVILTLENGEVYTHKLKALEMLKR